MILEVFDCHCLPVLGDQWPGSVLNSEPPDKDEINFPGSYKGLTGGGTTKETLVLDADQQRKFMLSVYIPALIICVCLCVCRSLPGNEYV